MPRHGRGDRGVGEPTGGDDVGDGGTGGAAGFAGFGEVDFQEAPMAAAELAERVEGLDDAGALSPARSQACRKGHDGDLAGLERGLAKGGELVGRTAARIDHVRSADILNRRAFREASGPQRAADRLVLFAVKAQFLENLAEALLLPIGPRALRDQALEDGVHGFGHGRVALAGLAEALEVGAHGGAERPHFLAEPAGDHQPIVGRRHHRPRAGQQVRPRAALVDGQVVDHGFHGKGQGGGEFAFGLAHGFLEQLLGHGFTLGGDDEAHPSAAHAAEHPKAPEIRAERGLDAFDEHFGVVGAGPGDDGLNRPEEVPRRGRGEGLNIPGLERGQDAIEHAQGRLAGGPFLFAAQEIFLADHFQDRPDVLGHPAMDEHQGIAQGLACRIGNVLA